MLQTVTLGSGGPPVPALGIGTWAWGDSLYWNYGKEYGRSEVQGAFQAALAAGVNFFDTAEIYGLGESEKLLGQFMQENDCPVAIATKYFPLPWRWTGQAVKDALAASLQRLQVPSVALYQVHWPFDFLMGQKTLMYALADEVKEGRILTVGVSNYSENQMRRAAEYLAEQGIPLAVNQVQYSLLHRNIETNGVLAAARELNITILAYSPLAQGLLSGKYRSAHAGDTTSANTPQPTGARKLNPRFSPAGLAQLEPLFQVLQEIGDRHHRTPAQVALNWLIAQGNVIPIPGVKNAQQAEQNAGALGWRLTPEEQAQLDLIAGYPGSSLPAK